MVAVVVSTVVIVQARWQYHDNQLTDDMEVHYVKTVSINNI